MKVYPNPKLPADQYVPGLGSEGAEFPDKEAEDLIERGLAVKNKPKSEPAPPADKPEE